jgi:SAM-dependent methyltransferase
MNDENNKERSTVEHWDAVYRNARSVQHLYLYNQQLLDAIVRTLGDDLHQKQILEVGCGKAKESLELSKRGASVTGVDTSPNAIGLLQEHIVQSSSSMVAILCDGRSLPFPEGQFDLVFSQGVIEHFDDPLPLLLEQFRVLKPGGSVIVEVPNRYNVYTLYKQVLMAIGRWPPGWETQYSPADLACVLRAAGFALERTIGWDTFILRAFRKIGKKFGFREKKERIWQTKLRRAVEGSLPVTWLALSLTIIAYKPMQSLGQRPAVHDKREG